MARTLKPGLSNAAKRGRSTPSYLRMDHPQGAASMAARGLAIRADVVTPAGLRRLAKKEPRYPRP
jgi:hypothetical protein